MPTVAPLTQLPPEFPELVDEVTTGIETLYGADAARHYRRTARATFLNQLSHPAVHTLGAFEGGRFHGLLVAAERDAAVGEIPFMHVLERGRGRETEAVLVREAVRALRNGGVDGIICECVPMAPLNLAPAFAPLGFRHIPREVMTAPLPLSAIHSATQPARRVVPLEQDRWTEAAAVFVDAYTDHPGQVLHQEVHDLAQAVAFCKRVASGHYGRFDPGFALAAMDPDRIAGVAFGSIAAAGVGFVVQIAVLRSHRGRGFATALLSALANAFTESGCHTIALGVTSDNPARRLYESLGFATARNVDAYAWWRPERMRAMTSPAARTSPKNPR